MSDPRLSNIDSTHPALDVEWINQLERHLTQVIATAKSHQKLSGFMIGNTANSLSNKPYLTPIRNTARMVLGGAIVYSNNQAAEIATRVDSEVQYVLVDAEKKIPSEVAAGGESHLVNIERAVKEKIQRAKFLTYKGNDLSVNAMDTLLIFLTRSRSHIRGVGGKCVTILGAGNLGSKLALKMVERGARVTLTRRNVDKLNAIVAALNIIKPASTVSSVRGTTDNLEASRGAEILVGLTNGVEVIDDHVVGVTAPDCIIIDVGKGTISRSGFEAARATQRPVYRLDVSAAVDGLCSELLAMEDIVENKMGRVRYGDIVLTSGGILGDDRDIVVDNAFKPTQVYGLANGYGDFYRTLSDEQKAILNRAEGILE